MFPKVEMPKFWCLVLYIVDFKMRVFYTFLVCFWSPGQITMKKKQCRWDQRNFIFSLTTRTAYWYGYDNDSLIFSTSLCLIPLRDAGYYGIFFENIMSSGCQKEKKWMSVCICIACGSERTRMHFQCMRDTLENLNCTLIHSECYYIRRYDSWPRCYKYVVLLFIDKWRQIIIWR